MGGLAALALGLILATPLAADPPADVKALASDLLEQADAAARERWLEAHRSQLTPALGREVAAQARVLYLASKYDPAYDAFTLAVRLGEIAADPESRIRGLEGLGGVERFRGRSQEALPFLERAMQEAEAAGDPAAVGRILGGLSSARRRLGEFGEALALSHRQLAVFESLNDAEWTGRAHNSIGIALGALGRYAEAIPHLEQARDASAAAKDAPRLSNVYSNLALCHQGLGNYAAALENYGYCLRTAEESGARNELGAPLNNIGILYSLQGAPERALEYHRRAYAIDAEVGEKGGMAEALANQGKDFLDLGRPQDARRALDEALALGEGVHDPTVIAEASALIAEIDARSGNRSRARELLDHVLETADKAGDFLQAAHTKRQVASLQLEAGEAAPALELAKQAVEAARRYELREDLWPALLVVGRAERALGHAEAAEAAWREAVEVVEDLRRHAVGPDADRAAFLISRAAPYQELVSLLADGGRSWDALEFAERSKGRVLLDVLAGGRLAIGPALGASDKAEERRLQGELLTVNTELRDLVSRPAPDPVRRKALESRRTAQRVSLEDWRARQYAAHPELRVLRGESRPLAAADVASLLGDGRTVLLEYVLCAPHAYLFVLSAGAAPAVHRLGVASAEIERLARDLRLRLAGRDLDFADEAARLHRALLSPAQPALRDARRVVIVPDGALWDLPFQALRAPSGRFLIQDLAVSYAPSLSVLRDMEARPRSRARSAGTLLAVGNPELASQLRAIAGLYAPGTSAVGVGAREAWFKAEAPLHGILHIATHGFLDDASPLYSQLELAAPAAGEQDDGLLEAREILDLDLGARLAVLSACETGRGRAGAGEGLLGMTWAFFVAGCPTTVASQWRVDAASTSRLMLAFHRELRAHRAPAEALRLAALAQLGRGAEQHPFYWAGFVTMGDGYAAAVP